MAKQHYSEEQKAVALAYYASCDNNQRKTSRDCNVPLATLQHWLSGGGINEDVTENSVIKKGELADRLEALAHLLIDAAPDKISEASLQMVSTSLGIAVDKMQLLRNKPTEIVEDASVSDERRADRIAELLDAARTRRDGQAVGADPETAPETH